MAAPVISSAKKIALDAALGNGCLRKGGGGVFISCDGVCPLCPTALYCPLTGAATRLYRDSARTFAEIDPDAYLAARDREVFPAAAKAAETAEALP